MNVSVHAAQRAAQREISAREILLTRNKPHQQWRMHDRIIRRRNDVVLVMSHDDTIITCYRDTKRR